jgi:hypothetical protein
MIGAWLLAAAAACSGDCKAQQRFEAMERKLLSRPLQVDVKCHTEGALRADAEARLFVATATRLRAQGTWQGEPFTRNFDQPTTPALREAVVIGMTRMGVLHNVARLMQGGGPDHADGTVRQWLEPHDFRLVKGGVAYRLRVGGREAGDVRLTLSNGLPRTRLQTVHFPNGDMRVTERYRFAPRISRAP